MRVHIFPTQCLDCHGINGALNVHTILTCFKQHSLAGRLVFKNKPAMSLYSLVPSHAL